MNKENLIERFSESLENGNGMIFVGSGISVPSGYPNWIELLNPLISNLKLTISNTDDLTEIAQFIVNDFSGNKGPLLHNIINIFKNKKFPNKYHDILVRTNIKKIWTTNYDELLEKSFNQFNTEIEVKTNDSDFIHNNSTRKLQIVKMHGCVNRNPNDIIITQEDYEDFFVNKPAISGQLQSDLLNNSFLFIGYNFGDSNIKNILVQTRRLSKQKTRPHFLIQKKDKSNSDKQELWCKNLKRFGIDTVLIKEYDDLLPILNKIAHKSKGKTIYITGSHENNSETFAEELGKELAIIENITLIDGQSTGISRTCINSYSQVCLKNNFDIHNRIRLFPNPYAINKDFSNDISLLQKLKNWRNPIFRSCQIVIVFDGGLGTKAELELAEQFDNYILPIPLKEGDLAHKTLNKLKDTIDNTYYEKANNINLKVEDVINYITKILND